MKKYFVFLFLLICFVVDNSNGHNLKQARIVGLPVVEKSQGKPWPKPQVQSWSPDQLHITSGVFQFISIGETCLSLQNALSRYFNIIFYGETKTSETKDIVGQLTRLAVNLTNPCEQWPHLSMDESYTLNIEPSSGAGILEASQIWGALRGLETFSQLIYIEDNGVLTLNGTQIVDYPRFSFRGVLLDTSRHFLPKSILLENLDSLAANKMNVFHWHITDDQSFPYESVVFPKLIKGAYNPQQTHTYTFQDIADVIEYARERGIRVIPEFDTPGHTLSWGVGYPELLTQCFTNSVPNGEYGPLDPSKNEVYAFLQNLFQEIGQVFQDDYIHLGADEVPFDCWQSNPNITAFMNANGITDYSQLEQYYISNLLSIVNNLEGNKSPIVWQEVFDNGVTVSQKTIIEVWKGGEMAELSRVTQAGHYAILSSCWYLDQVRQQSDWATYYNCEPLSFGGTPAQNALVMGGEACLWAEFVDKNNILSRLWPRASAVAERLWSDPTQLSTDEASPRLEEQRCRMVNRGLTAEPQVGPGSCNRDE